jgi:hypothetical protein
LNDDVETQALGHVGLPLSVVNVRILTVAELSIVVATHREELSVPIFVVFDLEEQV